MHASPPRVLCILSTAMVLLTLGLAATARADFGVSPGSFGVSLSTLQAGAHPDFTTSFSFNQNPVNVPEGRVKDVEFDLPAGLTGNPTISPTCAVSDLVQEPPACPRESAVGVAEVTFGVLGAMASRQVIKALIYNVVPYANEPAAFAFVALYPVRLDASLRSNGDYGIHIAARNVTEAVPVLSISITLWGVPMDHNGPGPELDSHQTSYGGNGGGTPLPLMTNPTLCGVGLTSSLRVTSWPETTDAGEAIASHTDSATASTPALSGCDRLSYAPSLLVRPETFQAGAPSGYEVDIHVPPGEDPVSPITPDLKDVVVTFPAGTVVSPSAADGLESCSEAQIGLHDPGPGACPPAATMGTSEIDTPVLADPLKGSIYLAKQNANPFGAFLAVYVVAEADGVVVKLAGEVHLDAATGRLTTRFLNNPQLPFSDLKLSFRGGPRAVLANPPTCGAAQSTAALTPWSSGQAAIASSAFNVSFDGDGAACPSPMPFSPTFSAGTVDPTAGAYSPLTLTLTRTDDQQELGAIQLRTPPGLLGMLSRVPTCPEPQASNGSCGTASLVGHTSFAVGAGPHPIYLAGNAFLTGPYRGAPFGLALVLHALAGPFDLGIIDVRAAISVDQHTAALTITSDPFPRILDGIPLQVKVINITIDRPGFIFNPTDCAERSIAATVSGVEGATSYLSSPFAASRCTSLPFKPKLTATSSAKTSRGTGASLQLEIRFTGAAQANIAKIDVALPKQMPARLTTIQHACLAAVFNVNPAACPAGSVVGSGKGHSPVLSGLLSGPIYLVSNGGKRLPSLMVLLQGDGVRIDLAGAVHVSNAGITSSSFGAVPDAPLSDFEVSLPRSAHSALTNTGDMCAKPLLMPATITAQNGAVIKQSPRIKVTGCPKKAKHAGSAAKSTRRGKVTHK